MNNSNQKILDLGCGKKKRDGAIGVDISDRHGADIIHDLNIFPYPFLDDEFEEIYLDNVLEHLENPLKVIEEIYRICKYGGVVKIIVPYFRSNWAFIDPTHKHFFTVNSMDYFDPRSLISKKYDYTDAHFYIEKIIFNESLSMRWTKRLATILANQFPKHYELYFSHLYPLDQLSYILRKS
jgi:predicted SAM-dependent methyltransferase